MISNSSGWLAKKTRKHWGFCDLQWQKMVAKSLGFNSEDVDIGKGLWYPTRPTQWHTKWGPQTIAKLVNITPMSLWFMVLITIVTGANLNQLITGGGPHCRAKKPVEDYPPVALHDDMTRQCLVDGAQQQRSPGSRGSGVTTVDVLWMFLVIERWRSSPLWQLLSVFICSSGWWFGTWILFFHILGRILPFDFHIFQRGRSTTNQSFISSSIHPSPSISIGFR